MAIVKQGNTTLNSGSKGDMPSFTINGTPVEDGTEMTISGGGGDTRTVAITTQAELINIANANKVLSIQANITLTSDISIPDGAILEYGGGTIDVNGKKVLFQNNGFGQMNANDKLFDFSYFEKASYTIIASAVGGEAEVALTVPADYYHPVIATVNGLLAKAFYDSDNQRLVFEHIVDFTQSLKVGYTLTAGDEVIVTQYTGIDNFSRVDENSTFKPDFIWGKWFGLVDTSDSALFDNRSVLKAILKIGQNGVININKGYYYVSVVETQRYDNPDRPAFVITGNTHVIGQGKDVTTIKTLVNDGLHKSAVFIARDAPNGSIQDLSIIGDMAETDDDQNGHRSGLTFENRSHDFEIKNCEIAYFSDGVNSYSWDNMGEPTGTFESGTLDGSGLPIASTTGEFRSNNLINISTAAKEDGFGMFTDGGYGGYSTLGDYSYDMYWYDVNGDFISKISNMPTYKDIYLPEGATQYRVVVPKTQGDVAPSGFMFRSHRQSKRCKITKCYIHHNRRNGVSNLQQDGIFDECYFYANGGRTAGPSYAIDQEDGYQVLSNNIIKNCVFQDNYGGAITMRWVRDVYIYNNLFMGNNSGVGGKSNINGRETWDTKIYNNRFWNTDVSIGRYGKIYQNEADNSDFVLANVYTELSDNVIYNGYVTRSGDAAAAFGQSISRNNNFIITKFRNNLIFGNDIKSINDKVVYRNDVTTGSGDFNYTQTSASSLTKDYMKGLEVIDAIAESQIDGISLIPKDLEDCKFSAKISLRGGSAEDMLWKNCTFKENIYQNQNNQAYSTDGSNFKDWIIDGGSITSSASNLGGSTYGSVLQTWSVDINLTVKNFTFDLTDATSAYFLWLTHLGTTVFENCIFKTDAASTFDMNRAGAITVSAITFKDCKWVNVTPTYRTGDIVITTPTNEVVQ